jgi:hypothetical protein
VASNTPSAQPQSLDNSHQIQELLAEVSQLRALLSTACVRDGGSNSLAESVTLRDTDETAGSVSDQQKDCSSLPEKTGGTELWNRSPRGYYRQHSLFQFFFEVRWLPVHSSYRLLNRST